MKDDKKADGFTKEERAAMKERARELKAEAKVSKNAAEGENDILSKIADLPEPERTLVARLHTIIRANAPDLSPKTWYGMPAYAREGKVVCFIQSAHKFSTRYTQLGFTDQANLDDGALWPTSYAITALASADEDRISRLVRKAVG